MKICSSKVCTYEEISIKMNLSTLVIIFISSYSSCFGSRILVVIDSRSFSHFAIVKPLAIELIKRGHELTLISNHPLGSEVTNYTFFDITYCHAKKMGTMSVSSCHLMNVFDNLQLLYGSLQSFECFFKSTQFQDFLNSGQKFDLVLAEYFISRLFSAFGFIFECPIVIYSACMLFPWVSEDLGNSYNPSYIPNLLGNSASKMEFMDRFRNTVQVASTMIMYELIFNSKSQRYIDQYFPPSVPNVRKLMKNVSVVLVNTHNSYFGAFPQVPGIVEIGGIHISEARKLPEVMCICKVIYPLIASVVFKLDKWFING